MDASEVTIDQLLEARLITKAALRPKAGKYDEQRRIDAIEHAKYRYAKHYKENKKLRDMMRVDNEYAQWFEVFNGVPLVSDDSTYMGMDSFAFTNNVIRSVQRWKERAKLAAAKKGLIALELCDCTDNRMRRILRIRLQTPEWVDYDKIKEVYVLRDRMNLETGIVHHVDHIVPLAGKKARGFHVHDNLEVITATENLKKHRKFDGLTFF